MKVETSKNTQKKQEQGVSVEIVPSLIHLLSTPSGFLAK